jgi:predicted ATPase
VDFNQPPVVRVSRATPTELGQDQWPATIPAVAQLLAEGIDLHPGVTFLVGENGSGKSTLVEAIAVAYGLSPEGGSSHGLHSTRPSESRLHRALHLQRGIGSGRWGFFLRAETMHGWYTFVESSRTESSREPLFHEMSHGESFIAVLNARFDSPGFYCLDETEAALSFRSTLTLIRVLHDIVAAGGQVLCATHSPVLAAMPGARILEVGDWDMRESAWDDLELVHHWKAYLDAPMRYLRHTLADD